MKKDIPQTGFFFDGEEGRHNYYLDGKKMTGVTTILGVLAKPALIPWAARMAADTFAEAVLEALEKGDAINSDFVSTKKEEAKSAHAKKRDEGATKGTDTHALVEDYINHCIKYTSGYPAPRKELGSGIDPFIDWAIKNSVRFLASEKQMYSKELFVAGTADFIFEKDGKTYIGDIKTYKKIWDRTPFYQCAGYGIMYRETVGIDIDGYCIFNLPKERVFDEAQDVLWSFDVEGDTKAFLACVEIYRQNAQFKPYNSYKRK